MSVDHKVKSQNLKTKSRGAFSMNHSNVSLSIDLQNARIGGYVEHKLVCKSKSINTLRIHARQMIVHKVLFNGEPTDFKHEEYLSTPCNIADNIRDLRRFNARYKAALDEEDKGGLIISIPPDLHDTITKGKPFLIRIYYTLTKPTSGVHFVISRESEVSSNEPFGISSLEDTLPSPHMFSHNEVESARCWIPCLDRYSQPCTWSLYYHVLSSYTVISSGEFKDNDKIMDDEIGSDILNSNDIKTFHFEISVPTTVKNIAVTAGEFECYCDPLLNSLSYFCLPGKLQLMEHTVKFMSKVFKYYEEYLGRSFPYESFKLVFVENSYTKMSSFAGIAIMSSQLLHGPSIIDKIMKARWLLSLSLSIQWFGNYISVKSWSDTWLRFGLSTHLAGQFFQRLYGPEEYRFQQYKNFMLVGRLDEERPPLNWNSPSHPIQYYQELLLKKSSIVISMIEQKLSPDIFRKIVSDLVSDSSKDGRLSTRLFLKTIKSEGWRDIKKFEQQWISGRGCPKMLAGFSFNKKRQQTEFVIKQTLPPNERFSGSLIVRVNELDGTYDYTIPFSDEIHGFDFKCQSKLRKNRKKKIKFPNGDEIEIDLTRRDNPLLWIRVDPICNWGPYIEFKQPEYMWIYQMEMDRDPIAQHQSITALCSNPTNAGSSALSQLMADTSGFYRIRIEAARGLAKCANKETEWVSLDKLLKFFKAQYFDETSKHIAPNDFSDISSYYLKKSVIESVSTIKDKEGYTPSDVLNFLLHLLQYNENTYNKFSDYKYIATIIRSLANTNPSAPEYIERIRIQIYRYLELEQQQPSYQRKITVACIKSLAEMHVSKKLNMELELFNNFSRYGHNESVRIVALKSIIWLFCPSNEALSLIISFLENPDESPRLKYKLLSGWSKFIITNKIRVAPFQEETEENIRLCNFLWKYLNSHYTAFDSRLRWTTIELYENLWGQDTPSCIPATKEPPPKLMVPSSSDIINERKIEKNDLVIPVSGSKRKTPDFTASYKSSEGILHIDVLNPSKRRKLAKITESCSRLDTIKNQSTPTVNSRKKIEKSASTGTVVNNYSSRFTESSTANSFYSASFVGTVVTIRHSPSII